MNKKLKITISIISIILVIAIFIVMYLTIFKTNANDVVLDVKVNSITIEVDQQIDLKDYYIVSPNESSAVLCVVDDFSVATINNENILTANKVGSTILYLKTSDGRSGYIEKELTINIIEKLIIPTNFSFEKELVALGIETDFVLNKIVCNENYNVTPSVTYSTQNICSYDAITGKIIPLSVGTTTVTVTFEKNNDKTIKSFDVVVKEKYRKIEFNLSKEDNSYVLKPTVNSLVNFTIYVYENNNLILTNTKLEIISNECGFSVVQKEYDYVICKATSKGEALIKISCYDDESVFEYIIIKVD